MQDAVAQLKKLEEDFTATRRVYLDAKSEASKASADHNQAKMAILHYLTEIREKSTRIGGALFTASRAVSCSVTQDNNDLVYEWIADRFPEEADDFSHQAVDKKPLLERLREELDEGEDASDYPDFLNVKDTDILSVRGWRG